METKKVLLETKIPDKELYARGKVRDTYEISGWPRTNGEKLLLMITTDRISAFDLVVGGVPELGKIRNLISLFWFEKLKDVCLNHIFSHDQQLCSQTVSAKYRKANDLPGRCALVRFAETYKVECVVRGYITGSGWKSYQEKGEVCGIKLPPGLQESERLPEPIFTPTTKAEKGHDEPISFDTMVRLVGGNTAEELRRFSIQLYKAADKWAEACGIIIADTKFEFGYKDGIILVDELLTPDSSRLWDKTQYRPGGSQPSYDKQPLRDWLEASGWSKKPPPPTLSDEIVEKTRARYIKAYESLVGQPWPTAF